LSASKFRWWRRRNCVVISGALTAIKLQWHWFICGNNRPTSTISHQTTDYYNLFLDHLWPSTSNRTSSTTNRASNFDLHRWLQLYRYLIIF
jgi:hypothetical protein